MLIGARGFQASIQAFNGESRKKLVPRFIADLVGERGAYRLFRSRRLLISFLSESLSYLTARRDGLSRGSGRRLRAGCPPPFVSLRAGCDSLP
jgi:hypothetical protein